MVLRSPWRKWMWFYFLGTFIAFIWIFVNFSTWCPDSDQLELEQKKTKVIENRLQKQVTEVELLRRKLDELQTYMKTSCQNEVKNNEIKNLPYIYAITPTYTRLEQKADLTRLSYTFRHVPNFHWIVVEDSDRTTDLVANFLQKSKVSYTHLYAATPKNLKLREGDPNWLKPRGVLQRNAGLAWVRRNARQPGVVYFADDDNTYDLEVFDEMRHTRKVTVWPVGLVGYLRYESPVLSNGKVMGWHTYWKPKRLFGMDMAGFAINAQLLVDHPEAMFDNTAGRGNLESSLLTQLSVRLEDLEPKADMCSKVLVWHTRTEKSSLKNEEKMMIRYGRNSSTSIEV